MVICHLVNGLKTLTRNIMKFNHNKELSYFQSSIDIIRHHGFNPIAVTQMYFEQVFVFKTDSEAEMAYELLEVQLEEVAGGVV